MINVQQYQELDLLNNYQTTTELEVVCGGLDFKSFYSQYDQRRGKNIHVFPQILLDWLNTIPETKLDKIQVLVNGNSTNQYDNDEELKKLAEQEGWILNPDNKNINDPLSKYE